MKKKRKTYRPEHLAFLRENYPKMGVRALAAAFSKHFGWFQCPEQIRNALSRHKIKSGRTQKTRIVEKRTKHLTEVQDQFLRTHYRRLSQEDLTKAFNREFGTDFSCQKIKTYIANNKILSGRTGRFEKGHEAWNLDTKGVMKRNSGTFVKGNVPKNSRAIGDERIDPKQGYVLIKVDEPSPWTSAKTHFKLKHIHVWERENGPVPEGMIVSFIDGNRQNVTIDNLTLLTRAELLLMNRWSYWEAPTEIKPILLTLGRMKATAFKLERREHGPEAAPRESRADVEGNGRERTDGGEDRNVSVSQDGRG